MFMLSHALDEHVACRIMSYELKVDIGRISWKLMLLRELTTKIIGVLSKKGLLFPA